MTQLTLRPALLIGGKSSRMGQNKSILLKNGVTLGIYLAQLLEKVTGEKPVLLGEGELGSHTSEFLCLPDPQRDRGPLAGLVAFAREFPEDNLLLLPTDLFAMSEPALTWLVKQAELAETPVIWPRQPQRKHGEPLAAIYKCNSYKALLEAWDQGKGSPCQAIPFEFRFEPLIPNHLRLDFVNINTPEELAAVKRGMQGQETSIDMELLFPTSKKSAHHSHVK